MKPANLMHREVDKLQMVSGSLKGFLITAIVFLMTVSTVYGQIETLEALNFSGDFRLRYERTGRQEPGNLPDVINDPRYREVVRFRMAISRQINGMFNFGARLATGSPDDPNTADITLGDFVNDLNINLDRVFMEFRYQNLFLTGGKFPNPFLRTDLVWDGDVNPQGTAASYTLAGANGISSKLTGIFYMVDEQTVNDDSYMLGGQLQVKLDAGPDMDVVLAGGYYDYTINSLTNADGGDTRSNYIITDSTTRYLSDFDLVDIIVLLNYRGFGDRYPVRLVGNYVKNQGAEVDEDKGFSADIYVGKASRPRDMRVQYGYSQLETDAVLAAFSNDNTTIATNYNQHTFGLDYVVAENTTLNLTVYHYKRNKVSPSTDPGLDNDYFTRIRLNAILGF